MIWDTEGMCFTATCVKGLCALQLETVGISTVLALSQSCILGVSSEEGGTVTKPICFLGKNCVGGLSLEKTE